MSNFTIIPAQPKTYVLYVGSDGNLFSDNEPVIAWRVETTPGANSTYTSIPYPVLSFGEPLDNCVGFLFESGQVSLQGSTYVNLESAQKEYKREMASRRGD